MIERRTIFLAGLMAKERACARIMEAPLGWICRITAPTRTDLQNKRLWPMISDIQKQVPGFDQYSAEDIKLRFLNALGVEMRYLPVLEGQGAFPVGMRSSTLTVDQFSGLIELLYQFGSQHGVRWSEPVERKAA